MQYANDIASAAHVEVSIAMTCTVLWEVMSLIPVQPVPTGAMSVYPAAEELSLNAT